MSSLSSGPSEGSRDPPAHTGALADRRQTARIHFPRRGRRQRSARPADRPDAASGRQVRRLLQRPRRPAERTRGGSGQWPCRGKSSALPLRSHTDRQVLTGATGALGAHLLHQLCQRPGTAKVICLCRAKDPAHARARIDESLRARKLPPRGACVVAYPAALGEPDLGLGAAVYGQLKNEVSVVIHVCPVRLPPLWQHILTRCRPHGQSTSSRPSRASRKITSQVRLPPSCPFSADAVIRYSESRRSSTTFSPPRATMFLLVDGRSPRAREARHIYSRAVHRRPGRSRAAGVCAFEMGRGAGLSAAAGEGGCGADWTAVCGQGGRGVE